jgi:hypothetical protein
LPQFLDYLQAKHPAVLRAVLPELPPHSNVVLYMLPVPRAAGNNENTRTIIEWLAVSGARALLRGARSSPLLIHKERRRKSARARGLGLRAAVACLSALAVRGLGLCAGVRTGSGGSEEAIYELASPRPGYLPPLRYSEAAALLDAFAASGDRDLGSCSNADVTGTKVWDTLPALWRALACGNDGGGDDSGGDISLKLSHHPNDNSSSGSSSSSSSSSSNSSDSNSNSDSSSKGDSRGSSHRGPGGGASRLSLGGELLRGKRVLELGAGSGLLGIGCSFLGAFEV